MSTLVLILLEEGKIQRDKIGRIFAYWAIVYSGQFFSKIWVTFSHGKTIKFDNKWATFGRFFTNKSGHPGMVKIYELASPGAYSTKSNKYCFTSFTYL
jgi:hypothetical protein